ncbi:MAG: hypothetical protein KGZ53_01075 [Peptococcaceae bacterium]|nr:hypothetical protein [Peptococcaceae bacterium]
MEKAKQDTKRFLAANWRVGLVSTLVIVGVLVAGLLWSSNEERKAILAMPIENVNISSIHDGDYDGEYTFGGFKYQVCVLVKDRKITSIEVTSAPRKVADLTNRVAAEVLAADGNLHIEVGNSAESKAVLLAIHNALVVGVSDCST